MPLNLCADRRRSWRAQAVQGSRPRQWAAGAAEQTCPHTELPELRAAEVQAKAGKIPICFKGLENHRHLCFWQQRCWGKSSDSVEPRIALQHQVMDALKPLLILLICSPIWVILHAIATAHNLGVVTLVLGLAAVVALLPIRTRKRRAHPQATGERQHRCRPSSSQRQNIGIENHQNVR